MIRSVEISNFKCFYNLKLQYGNLTLLTGFNSGGKSSAIQPLLLLAQGMRMDPAPTKRFPLNGPLVRLGAVSDLMPLDGDASTVGVEIETTTETRVWSLEARPGERALRFDSSGVQAAEADYDYDAASASSIKIVKDLMFISAVRGSSVDDYPTPDIDTRRLPDVGFDGRYACFEYHRAADDEVSSGRRFPDESATSFRKQVDAWLGSLFPGAEANVQYFPQLALFSLEFRASGYGEWRRPANVGYGFSYAFPIIVALLIAKPGQLVIIDSPEAHLHPRAQSQMGRLLAQFAAAGVQIVVESHSDHLLNGVRLAVRSRLLRNEHLQIHFFRGAAPRVHGVVSPQIDQHGDVHEWPEGFFDQAESDIAKLSGWA